MERIIVRLHGKDFALSRTIRVDRHAAHRKRPDAADDTGDAPQHRPNVYVIDVPRDDSYKMSSEFIAFMKGLLYLINEVEGAVIIIITLLLYR